MQNIMSKLSICNIEQDWKSSVQDREASLWEGKLIHMFEYIIKMCAVAF